ncbi:hypothetical protein CALVIDRAFT_600605 [Calocera viscosa TUFC12733]|uniref:SWI/SNF and RSC complexes subunit Ssr4 N-terminal domain-containing protein n=1 Tax=Calocera viscosa (strain TUFC12733) TaxID=1330018 RepID=A0A167JIN6_CALVF|nr:hypothetical protein CALVIDRAFT_600605 [Calocera viscosa TUFC12733]
MMQPGMPQSHPGMQPGGQGMVMQQGMQQMNPAMMQNMQNVGNPMTPMRGPQQQVMQPDPSNHYLRANQCLPLNQPLTYELAVSYLMKSLSIAQQTAFYWLPIDKPADNDLYLVYHTNAPNVPWAADGVRYLDGSESSFRNNIGGHELEVKETKYGFVPGVETQANRVRRKFRLLKGGSPHLWLIHYSRAQAQAVPPIFQSTPSRKYPIPPPPIGPVWVLNGPRPGQPMQQQQQQVPGRSPQKDMQRAMMMAQQQQQRAAAAAAAQHAKVEEDSDDEPEFLTKRDLAKARYMRNHEFMQDIFGYPGKLPDPAADPWTNQTPSSLEEKLAKLESEIAAASAVNEQRTSLLKSARRDPEAEAEAEMEMEAEGARGDGGDEPDVPVEEIQGVLALPERVPAEPVGVEVTVPTPEANGERPEQEKTAPLEGEEVDMEDADADEAEAEAEDGEEGKGEDMEADGEEEAEGDADGDADADEAPAEDVPTAEGAVLQPDVIHAVEVSVEVPAPLAEEQAEATADAATGTPAVPSLGLTPVFSEAGRSPLDPGAPAPVSTSTPASAEIAEPEPVSALADAEGDGVEGIVPERSAVDPHEVADGPAMADAELPPQPEADGEEEEEGEAEADGEADDGEEDVGMEEDAGVEADAA